MKKDWGQIVFEERTRKGLSQVELSAAAGVSPTIVSLAERSTHPFEHIAKGSLRKLARFFDINYEDFIAGYDNPKLKKAIESAPIDANVQPYSEQAVPEIPTFDLPVAAGPWMELPDVDQMRDGAKLKDGRFRIRIRGDSMQKNYPDGSLIEFRCLMPDFDGVKGSLLEVGADYYVQKAECATFKRLVFFNYDLLIFSALNRKRYPEKIEVLRSDVSRMAKAEYVLLEAK